MSSIIIKFDTLDISEVVESLQDQMDFRINMQLVPKRHGGLLSEVPVAAPRRIKITGRISEVSHDVLRNTVRGVNQKLSEGRKKLRWHDDRYVNAIKEQFGYSYVPGSAMRSADFTMAFICDDPFEYTDATFTSTETLTAADTAVDVTNNIYKKSFVYNNTGTAFNFLKVTVTASNGPITKVIVRNQTTSRLETYTGTIASTKSLVMDNGNFSIKNDGTEDYVNWSGSFIWINASNNTIEIEGTPGTYLFEFSPRYW